jgi:hypothetical protein
MMVSVPSQEVNRQGAKDAMEERYEENILPCWVNSRAKGFAIPLWNGALLISP